ncbi:uncharacterized protein [Physeter macrocephalus]|uniref:Uncharacterized protein isoform X1 n=1 Tax=Physeter macrocephalus TaxID=9755 RepID=A0A9W2WDD9_PHYMC|nr:uncharacterized protein LOC129391673 isoform X1 [Physeter catodon]
MKAAKLWSWSETSGVSRSSGTAYGHPLLDHGSPAPRLEQRIICTGKGIIERTGSSLDGRTLTRSQPWQRDQLKSSLLPQQRQPLNGALTASAPGSRRAPGQSATCPPFLIGRPQGARDPVAEALPNHGPPQKHGGRLREREQAFLVPAGRLLVPLVQPIAQKRHETREHFLGQTPEERWHSQPGTSREVLADTHHPRVTKIRITHCALLKISPGTEKIFVTNV